MTTTDLVRIEHVRKSFTGNGGDELLVLDDISLDLREGEIVALLGRSGSGKSTLLRTVAGLVAPSSGTVRFRGRELDGANPGAAMVFQTFALMPWLTVRDNVELGLVARGMPPAERRRRASEAIDLVGLDGFASAYPKELSGGMRQRVGFARALVREPDLLLMDEPFSALDVLTAENLRAELTDLWAGGRFPARAVCLVTHNIEEAVQLADRVLVLGTNPGRIRADVAVALPRPRDRASAAVTALVEQLYRSLTETEDGPVHGPEEDTPGTRPLPQASVDGVAGLVEIVAAHGGRADLPDVAAGLNFEIDDLLPLVDAAGLLDLLTVAGGDLHITPAGWAFTTADIQRSKTIFAEQARTHAPLVRAVHRGLCASPDGTLRSGFVLDLLGRSLTPEDARRQLDTAVDWGRYAELYDYDAGRDRLTLDPSGASAAS